MINEIDIRPEVANALAMGKPVVALESTLIAHGLPSPTNVETAHASEAAVRAGGAVPATIAVLNGRPTVGLKPSEIEHLATQSGVIKAGRRDLALAVTSGLTAATTVSGTMAIAHLAGIRVFATGGIGGVHRGDGWDISSDLTELGRTPMAVVCAGAKNLLDLPATLEYLETLGVPVIGYRCAMFPAFYVMSSERPVQASFDNAAGIARFAQAHWQLGGAGIVIAQPPPADRAIGADEFQSWLIEAERRAAEANVTGGAVTPFLLKQLAEISGGRTLELNRDLIVANAGLAAGVAMHM